MKLFKSVILFLALSVSLSSSSYARGGVSDGGGNSVFKDPLSKPLLLDLFVANPALQDDYRDAPSRALVEKPLYSVVSPRPLPVNYMKVSEQVVYPYVLERLSKWQATSPEVTSTIESALTQMEFWVVEGVKPQQRYVLKEELSNRFPKMSIQTVAAYGESIGGAILSRSLWNQLGKKSQAGLLIHEALRHIQMVELKYGASPKPGFNSLSDEALQRMTARIILDEPNQSESIIEEEALGSYLRSRISNSKSNFALRKASLCIKLGALSASSEILREMNTRYCTDEYKDTQPWAEGVWLRISDSYTDLRSELQDDDSMQKAHDLYIEARSIYYAWVAGEFDRNTFEMEQLNFRVKNFGILFE